MTKRHSSYMRTICGLLAASILLTGCSRLKGDSTESTSASGSSSVTLSTMPTGESSSPVETVLETQPPESFTDDLINYFYINLIGREATADELASLEPKLEDGSLTINDIVISIINSSEFSSLSYSNESYIDLCYNTIARTLPEEDVRTYWLNLLENDESRANVAQTLMATDGFRELCSSYGFMPDYDGVTSSSSTPREVVESANGAKVITGLGGYIPSSNTLTEINSALSDLSSRGWNVGFLIIDLQSNQGIGYNLNQDFYMASSVKSPFAVSLAMYNQEAASNRENTIINMLVNSDNDAYTILNDSYRRTYIQQFCEECGVDPALCVYKYPHVTSRDLALMWIKSYYYFEEDEYGATVGSWLENPVYSLINSELGETYTTRSKAGWVADDNPKHTTTVDAGIVYTDRGDYVIVIMSRVPSSIEPLRPLMQALNNAHNEM